MIWFSLSQATDFLCQSSRQRGLGRQSPSLSAAPVLPVSSCVDTGTKNHACGSRLCFRLVLHSSRLMKTIFLNSCPTSC